MNRASILKALALAAALAAGYYYFFLRAEPEPTRGPGYGGYAATPASVRVAPVEQGAFEVRASFVGTLRAAAFAELYARTSGQIVEMNVNIGEPVRRGQVLARIDPVEALEQVERERAALRVAEATVAQRLAALKVAETTDDRVSALYQQQLVSQQDQESARAELLSAQATLAMSEASVEVARANLAAAQVALEKTAITAPFDGFIGKRYLDLGAFAAANRPVFSVVDLSTIRTTISLVEKDAGQIALGQGALVETEAFGGEAFTGRVARIAPVFDPETHTVEAEVEVPNPDGRLKPGMFATVAITFRTEPTALLVPRAAVLEGQREQAVFVTEETPADPGAPGDGGEPALTARRVPVRRLGDSTREGDDRVAVEGQLAAGDAVITLGQERLRDGAPVRVTDSPGEAAAPPQLGLMPAD